MELWDKTIIQVLKETVAAKQGSTAYHFDNKDYTWDDVDLLSDAAAMRLYRRGIRKGTFVGLWGVNTIAWVIYYYAIQKLGAVSVLLNYSFKAMEMGQLINSNDVEFLLIGEGKPGSDFEKIFNLMQPKLNTVRDAWYIEREFDTLKDEPVNDENRSMLFEIRNSINSKDSSTIIFTSGTTAMAKGVLLSHYGIVNDARAVGHGMHWTGDEIMLIAMPMFHCSGLTCALIICLCLRMESVIIRHFSTIPVMEAIQKYKCSIFNAVPSMLLILKESPNLKDYDLSSFKSGTMGGSKISYDEFKSVCDTFKLTNYLSVYGQTECSPIICMGVYGDPIERTLETIGKPLENVEMRIWLNDKNCEAPVGVKGEIQTKTFSVMNGYYNRPEYNGKKFTEDGWLKTNDIGYIDEDGYYHFECRADDLIIRAGENISPSEIEDCIHHLSPSISFVRAVGVPAPIVQEEIVVFFEAIKKIDPDEVKRYVKTYLANFKVPKYVFQLDEMPMTTSGKIDDKRLRQMAKEMVSELQIQ